MDAWRGPAVDAYGNTTALSTASAARPGDPDEAMAGAISPTKNTLGFWSSDEYWVNIVAIAVLLNASHPVVDDQFRQRRSMRLYLLPSSARALPRCRHFKSA
jgi:hypothetical protein